MRENAVTCDRFNFISMLEIKGRKAVNEHPTFFIRGHVPKAATSTCCATPRARVSFTGARTEEGRKELFSGVIQDIGIHTENYNSILCYR